MICWAGNRTYKYSTAVLIVPFSQPGLASTNAWNWNIALDDSASDRVTSCPSGSHKVGRYGTAKADVEIGPNVPGIPDMSVMASSRARNTTLIGNRVHISKCSTWVDLGFPHQSMRDASLTESPDW